LLGTVHALPNLNRTRQTDADNTMELFADWTTESPGIVLSALGLLAASFSSLFSVANPPAIMPVFLSLTADYSERERVTTAKWTTIYAFGVLIVFLYAGTAILSFFGISLPGIRIAGGLIIMRTAFTMLNPEKAGKKLSPEDEEAALKKDDITFSPLAMPMLSGPGSIAVVIGFGSQATGMVDYLVHSASITLVIGIAYFILRVSPATMEKIGTTGMTVLTRMMGFIALAISVQFILSGIDLFFEL
ncbi:MAG: MarC family NAAT transporter, partial [Bacteroidota bacterium]